MSGTTNNLVKSDSQWARIRVTNKNRAFANRTDAQVRSGSVRRDFAKARDAALAAKAEDEGTASFETMPVADFRVTGPQRGRR